MYVSYVTQATKPSNKLLLCRNLDLMCCKYTQISKCKTRIAKDLHNPLSVGYVNGHPSETKPLSEGDEPYFHTVFINNHVTLLKKPKTCEKNGKVFKEFCKSEDFLSPVEDANPGLSH